MTDLTVDNPVCSPNRVAVMTGHFGKWNLGEAEQVHASIIAEGDEGKGRILALLKETGIDKRTPVVFSTDIRSPYS